MHLKLIAALAFLALASARSFDYDHYFINIVDNGIVVTGKEGRQVDIITKYLPEQYGQQYIKVFVNGPDFPAKTVQYGDYEVNAGVYQSDIFYQIFNKYSGYLDGQTYIQLLNVIEKYVQLGEIHPVVYQALQYLYYQNQDYLKDALFTEGGILGQDYYHQSQVPYSKLGFYYGQGYYPSYYNKYYKGYNSYYGQDYYQTPYNKVGYHFGLGGYSPSKYYGSFYQQYPYKYGSYYGSQYSGYPSTYQYGGYYGPYANDVYQYRYGYGYQQYPQWWNLKYGGQGYGNDVYQYKYGYQRYPQWWNQRYGTQGYNYYGLNTGMYQGLNTVVPSYFTYPGQYYNYPSYQYSSLYY